MTVLVGYAGEHGSTRDIAGRLAARLREHGLRADLRPLAEVADPGGYRAFVLGSAVHDRAWLPEAAAFLRRHAAVIAGRPVWLFSVGMAEALGRPLRSYAMRKEPGDIAGFRETLRPRGTRLLSGVITRDHLPLSGHLAFRALGGRYGDYRDWSRIDDWADEIARELR